MADKLRLAWFSPLLCGKGKESRSAYFSETILPHLAEKIEIECFHDGFERHQNYQTYHFLRAAERDAAKPFDLFFYQLEDSPVTNFSRIHLALKPGVVLFHDLLLSDDGPEPILNSPYKSIVARFKDRSIPWPARDAENERERPYAVRELSFALLPLFSAMRDSATVGGLKSCGLMAERCFADGNYLPWPIELNRMISKELPAKCLPIIAICGSAQVEHRAHKIFEALSDLRGKFSEVIWLVTDRNPQQGLLAARSILEEFEHNDAELIVSSSPFEWKRILERLNPASDAACHMHFSMYGQPGPYLQMSLAAGVACITNDFADGAELPDNVLFKVSAGLKEASELREALKLIFNWGSNINLNPALEWVCEMHDVRMVARELLGLLIHAASDLKAVLGEWKAFEAEARASLLQEVRGITEAAFRKPEFKPFGVSLSDQESRSFAGLNWR